jgi:hypothetical protein
MNNNNNNNNKNVKKNNNNNRKKAAIMNQSSGFKFSRPIMAPAGAGTITGAPRPRFSQARNDAVVIHNAEVFNNITVVTAAVLTMSQNLIPAAFPWLNGVATNFSKFRWRKLRFVYIPACPTSTSGALTMGVVYDTNDTAPTTRAQLASVRDSTSTPIWAGWEGSALLNTFSNSVSGCVYVDVDVARVAKPWYSYSTPANFAAFSTTDRNMYSPGVIFGISDGGPAVQITAGTVYGVYEVELIEPIDASINR